MGGPGPALALSRAGDPGWADRASLSPRTGVDWVRNEGHRTHARPMRLRSEAFTGMANEPRNTGQGQRIHSFFRQSGKAP